MELTKEEALSKIEELKNYIEALDKPVSLGQELITFPERFERLVEDGWEQVTKNHGLACNGVNIINTKWNRSALNDKVYHIEFDGYNEIIRRR